ncbi:hypothetical protein QFC19_000740 [Naganishia cerealis]|uniref:Uncharacterized protein n=1 Tax=Naganishia cerealis TaxID=610337 RepID=A0ACC2WMC5_9TREE|nr:hypothetical protein QFC19_000740 [Naganishia cerealis]
MEHLKLIYETSATLVRFILVDNPLTKGSSLGVFDTHDQQHTAGTDIAELSTVATFSSIHPSHHTSIDDSGPHRGTVADQFHRNLDTYTFGDLTMSTFAALLPSLQATFFSKSQPVAEDVDTIHAPSRSLATETGSENDATVHSVENTPIASGRPSVLRSCSSASSNQSGSPNLEKNAVDELVWKHGERVKYDRETEIRSRKEGKRGLKGKRRGETETFVIVRPPPSSKRALNLQIQLVASTKKNGAEQRESRSASGSSVVSNAATNVAIRALNIADTNQSLSMPTNATGTPREVDFKGIVAPRNTQSRDASPTRAIPGDYNTDTVRNPERTTLHKRTSSRSFDLDIQERKQNLLRNTGQRERPLSLISGSSGQESAIPAGVGNDTLGPQSQSQRDSSDADAASTKEEDARSLDEQAEANAAVPDARPLSRSSSIGSMGSSHSYASTSVSVTSGISLSGLSASSSSSRSGRRGRGNIVPLYNLAVHNVMTTTVTDAGTDSKIAKFHKRSVDIVGLGTLEATEICVKSPADLARRSRHSQSAIASDRVNLAPPISDKAENRQSMEDTGSTGGSSFQSDTNPKTARSNYVVQPESPSKGTAQPPFDRTKKLLGKLFKKKEPTTASSVPLPSPSKQGFQAIAEHLTLPLSPQATRNPFASTAGSSTEYGLPTFGMSPTIVNVPVSSSTSRPRVYTWTVKRWVPAGELTIVNEWTSRLAPLISGDSAASTAALGEVVFEWKKGRSKRSAPVSRTTTRASMQDTQFPAARNRDSLAPLTSKSHPGSAAASRRSSYLEADPKMQAVKASFSRSPSPSMLRKKSSAGESAISTVSSKVSFDDRAFRRDLSEVSQQPTLQARASSPAPSWSSQRAQMQEDEGDESDPEDSETPWICKVYVPGDRVTAPDGPISAKGKTVGTLYPAPHHPRVVAQIKIPVEIGNVATGIGALMAPATSLSHQSSDLTSSINSGLKSSRPGISSPPLTGTSQLQPQQHVEPSFKQEEIVMTEENIKDVVSVTAMWLVSREFGASGKKKKGSC